MKGVSNSMLDFFSIKANLSESTSKVRSKFILLFSERYCEFRTTFVVYTQVCRQDTFSVDNLVYLGHCGTERLSLLLYNRFKTINIMNYHFNFHNFKAI